jgi:hypothetical protein
LPDENRRRQLLANDGSLNADAIGIRGCERLAAGRPALSEQLSGIDLDNFFDVWLYGPEKPVAW